MKISNQLNHNCGSTGNGVSCQLLAYLTYTLCMYVHVIRERENNNLMQVAMRRGVKVKFLFSVNFF